MGLYNIFKCKNATKLANPILKNSYKVLLEAILFVTLRRPMHFLWVVEFLATFKLRKVAKQHFLESLHKSLKTR